MFSRHTFCPYYRFYFLRRIAGIPFVDNIAKRRKLIIVVRNAVYTVAYRYKTNFCIRKQYFGIISDHYVIPAESRHILDDHRSDFAVLYIRHHSLKVGTIEIRSRKAIVNIKSATCKTVFSRVIFKNFLLMRYTV